MVEFVGFADPVSPFTVTARPNSVSGQPGLLISMVILVPASLIVGLAFMFIGAWPVTLFMSLHILAVVAAFLYVEHHASDFERLTLANDRLIVDTHTPDEDKHFEFNGCWVQVDLQPSPAGRGNSLYLRFQGKEVPIGLLMSDDERRAVSQELRRRLARLRN